MRLYSYWRSSASWRVRIALAYKGIAYEYVPVHLLRNGGEQNADTYRALNPMGQVPLLEVTEGSVVHHIGQSLAILDYLEETVPTPTLLPGDRWQRALARQMAEIVNSGIQPLQNVGVQRYIKHTYGGDPNAFAAHWIERGLGALEALARDHAGTFLVGDAVSLADVCLPSQMYAARRVGVDVGRFTTLVRVDAHCVSLPAFQQAHADRQPDAGVDVPA